MASATVRIWTWYVTPVRYETPNRGCALQIIEGPKRRIQVAQQMHIIYYQKRYTQGFVRRRNHKIGRDRRLQYRPQRFCSMLTGILRIGQKNAEVVTQYTRFARVYYQPYRRQRMSPCDRERKTTENCYFRMTQMACSPGINDRRGLTALSAHYLNISHAASLPLLTYGGDTPGSNRCTTLCDKLFIGLKWRMTCTS